CARHRVLASRRGATEPDTLAALAALRRQGVAVHAVACDVTDRAALAGPLLAGIAAETPLRGIVHAAMVIDDALARNTDAARIERVLAPKLLGAQHLDALTAGLALDFFVCFSSATTLFGNPGQSNYVAANAWLEAFCRARRERGLPATSVAWGALDDVGYLARNAKVKDALAGRMGGQALRSDVALQALEDILLADRSDLGVLELDWNALARFLPSAASPKFGDVARRRAQAGGPDLNDEDIRHLAATLDDAALQARLVEILKAEVGEILRVPMDRLDASRSVYDMGLDSLMGVELVVALENRCGLKLPVMALSESPTIEQLAERLVALLRGESDTPADATAAQVRQVAAQHAADVPADSLAEFAADLDAAAPRQKMIH
ncbi:beta-ketoacyl reductase, partial [Bordetella bronchiseptica]|uniref:beta-ketoacyl reductase n=1 Tax=Bordetella bronchiseptica TaxID=518 RepID=UPI0012497035